MSAPSPDERGVALPSGFIPRFAGPQAFSQVVIQPVLAFLSVNAFVAGIFGDAHSRGEAIALVVVATLAAWLFFSGVGFAVNRFLGPPTRVRAVAVTATFGVTELVRISTLYSLLAGEEGITDFGVPFRSVSAVVTGIVLLGLVSVAVNDFRSYRSSYRSYYNQLARVRSAVHETGISVEMVRDQLALKVRRLLTHDIHEAFHPPATDSKPPDRIADELFRIADEIVRPLSHGVFEEPLPSVLPSAPEKPPRVSVRNFFTDVTSAAPFQPVIHTLIVGLIFAPVLILLSRVVAVVSLVACVGLVFLVAHLGHTYLTPVLPRWPLLLRVIVLSVLFGAPVVIFMAVVVAPGVTGLESLPAILAYGAGLGAVLGWLPAIGEGLRHSRQRFITELEPLDNGLEWFRVRAQSQLWLDQKRLALALHGDVQATVLAAAMQLKKAVRESPDTLQAVIDRVEETIRTSLLLEPTTAKAKKLTSVVKSINQTWSSLLTLRVEATPAVLAVVENDRLALEVVAEVVKELHINAFKHGRATQCEVTITQATPDTIDLRVCNNGSPLPAKLPGWGLGGRFLDTVSLEKTSQNTPEGVCVELSIPVRAAGVSKSSFSDPPRGWHPRGGSNFSSRPAQYPPGSSAWDNAEKPGKVIVLGSVARRQLRCP